MKGIKYLVLLLAAVILWAGPLPAPAPAADIFTLEWVRSTQGGSGGTYHSYMDPLTVDRESNVYVCHLDGWLYVYAPDRSLKWKVDLRQYSYTNQLRPGLGPVLDDAGNCYIASAGNNKVYKIDANGEVRAEFLMAGPVAASTSPTLSADGGALYVVTSSQQLYALNAADLSLKWQARTRGSSAAVTPLAAPDGTVVAGADQTITAFDPAGGEQRWEYGLPEDRYLYQHFSQGQPKHEKRLQVDGAGRIYAMINVADGTENRSELICLAPPAESGGATELRWTKEINRRVSAPALRGDTLYYCTADNRLHAVDAANGATRWELEVDAQGEGLSHRAPAVAADGRIFFAMGAVVGAARDDGTAGTLLGACGLPSKKAGEVSTGAVSRLGPHGEFYTAYTDVSNKYWLAKVVDNHFAPVPGAIELAPGEADIAMAAGGSYAPALTLRDTNGVVMSREGLVLASSDSDVVGVSGGTLTARRAGGATVTVTHPGAPGLSAAINVTVLGSLDGGVLSVIPAPVDITVGRSTQLTAVLRAAGGGEIKGEPLEWSSSNADIAGVTEGGLLTGKNAGSTTVLARLKNHTGIYVPVSVNVRDSVVRRVALPEINDKIGRTVGYFKAQGAPGTDWSAFALNAVGEDLSGSPYITSGQTYLDRLEARAKAAGYFGLMTDYERTVIGVVSAGGDPANFAGFNLLEKIYDFASLGQGINAAVFGLAALDAANAAIPPSAVHNRESLINFILNNRVKEGWCYGGAEPDPDMTGMALYALAPYRERPAVKEAGEAAIRWLSEAQAEDGTMNSWGSKNSESIAQTIMGVTAWGVDPQGPLFTKREGNLVTALLGFYFEDSGMFGHKYGTPDPAMATDQGLEALAALKRYMEKGYSDIFYKIVSNSREHREITALEITPEGLEIPPGCQVQLRVADQSGRYVDNDQVDWSVSDSAVVSVDQAGVLTANAPGPAQVTAALKEDGTVRDAVSLTVTGDDLAIRRANDPVALFGVNRAVTLTVENKSSARETVVLIITLVDRDTGKMVNSSYITREIAPGETAELTGAVEAPETGNYQVKTMLWNGWDKLRPLTRAMGE